MEMEMEMEMILWIVLIIVFAVLEMATIGLTSIWFAGGAFAAFVCSLIGLNLVWQFVVFIVVSLVLIFFTRPWALKYLKPHLTKTNYESNIGQNVCVTETIDNKKETGTVVLKGQEWTARASEEGRIFESGMIVKVEEIRGVTMYVTESEAMPKKEALQK